MPYHKIDQRQLFVHDSCLILDTNLLIKAFVPNQDHHKSASDFLEIYSEQFDFIIPIEVLIEAWGLIAGKGGRLELALELYGWAGDSKNVQVVYLGNEFYDAGKVISQEINVDIVDSILIHASQRLALTCELSKPIPIATYETRDYIKYIQIMHSKKRLQGNRRSGSIILWDPQVDEPNVFAF